MTQKLLLFITSLIILSCSNLKYTHQQLSTGNYDLAINNAINYLSKKKYGKKAPDYNQILFSSYNKAVERDKRTLNYLNSDNNPEGLERIFSTYLQLEKRQNKIRALLPIEGYNFVLEDYTMATINTKNKLSDYLYNKAINKLNSNNKQYIREAHQDFKYINSINPNYKNVHQLINESHYKGIDYVYIDLKNNTQFIIPKRLKKDLLNINQYDLDDYWIEHHTVKVPKIKYDYLLTLSFENIQLSPEKVSELLIIKEKQIKDGQKYVLDDKGNVLKDEKGNDIKTDKYIKVKSSLHQFTQFKECTIYATANIINNYSKQTIATHPYKSNFVFQHIYATQTGDKRALTKQLINILKAKPILFPSNEQMILDAGNDIKNQLKKELTGLKF